MVPFRLAPLLCLFVCALAPAARGDLLVGHVQDPMGVGVAAVNIDIQDMFTGADVVIFNDSTDANGDFAVTVPAGLYRVIFFPPPPPTTTLLTGVVENVAVVGTTSMGTIVLEAGVGMAGRVVSPANVPLPAVDLDIVDLTTKQNLWLSNDLTDAAGLFAIAVPTHPINVQLDPKNAPGGTFAPTSFELSLTADTNLGNVQLAPGFIVSMNVVGPGGAGVLNADLDLLDPVTGDEFYTPGDNTDSAGFVDVTLAAGTYDIEICPQFADRLVGRTLFGVTIGADVHLGTVPLQQGVVLSGHVNDSNGVSIENVDLNVFIKATGDKVTTCGDNTDSAGNYAIVIPTGNFDVVFTPPAFTGLDSLTVPLTVNGDTTLNATLDSCPDLIYCTPTGADCPNTQMDCNTAKIGISGCSTAGGSIIVSFDQDPTLFIDKGFAGYLNVSEGGMGTSTNPISDGVLCLLGGGPIGRYSGPDTQVIDVNGHMQMDILNSAKTGGCDIPIITNDYCSNPGTTWTFQWWFRRSMMNPTSTLSGFSQAMAVTIH